MFALQPRSIDHIAFFYISKTDGSRDEIKGIVQTANLLCRFIISKKFAFHLNFMMQIDYGNNFQAVFVEASNESSGNDPDR